MCFLIVIILLIIILGPFSWVKFHLLAVYIFSFFVVSGLLDVASFFKMFYLDVINMEA